MSAPTFEEVTEAQGWNLDSIESILRQFITSIGQDDALVVFAQAIANEENEV